MFPYLRSAEEFLDDCGDTPICEECDCENCESHSELVNWLEECVNRANWYNCVKKSEIKAWCQSVCHFLKDAIINVDCKDKISVGLEYYLETREGFRTDENPHYRADVMIAGYGSRDGNPEKRVLVIELKQYGEITEIIDDNGKIKWTWEYGGESRSDECPNSQVAFYCNNMSESINNSEDSDTIIFVPCVYMHNLSIENLNFGNDPNYQYFEDDNRLIDNRVKYHGESVDILLKDYNVSEYISQVFDFDGDVSDCGKNVFKEIRKRYKSVSLAEMTDILVCDNDNLKEYEKRLRPDQFFILNGFTNNNDKWDNYIKKHIDYISFLRTRSDGDAFDWKIEGNKSFSSSSILDVIEGGPGSGKTFLAMLIIKYCIENDLTVSFIYRKAAPKNAILDSFNNPNFKLLYLKDFVEDEFEQTDIYIMDEAQTFDRDASDVINRIMENGNPHLLVYMYDRSQTITVEEEDYINIIESFEGFTRVDDTIKCNTREVNRCNKYKIWSQFRCNRNEGFLSWIDHKLGIRSNIYPANFAEDYDVSDYDVEIINPEEITEEIRDKIKDRSLLVLAADYKFENADIKEIVGLSEETSIKKVFNPGMLNRSDEYYNWASTTHIRGIEYNEVLVIVKGLFKHGRVINNERIENILLKNEYRILLSRGLNKCYICCMDNGLKDYLLE